jgi:DNA replication protein DnaC
MDGIETILKAMKRNAPAGPSQGQSVRSISISTGLCDPDCPTCNGLGYVRSDAPVGHPNFGKIGPCPESNPFQRYKGLLGLDQADMTLTWANVIERENVRIAVAAVKQVIDRGYGWVYLHGDYGLAKTLILKIAVAEFCRATRQPASYTRMAEIIDHLRGAFDAKSPSEESAARLDMWSELPFLAIDEFDRVRSTEYATERRFVLMDRRYEQAARQKSITLMASNCTPDDLEGYLADRIYDGRFAVIHLKGVSARPFMSYD